MLLETIQGYATSAVNLTIAGGRELANAAGVSFADDIRLLNWHNGPEIDQTADAVDDPEMYGQQAPEASEKNSLDFAKPVNALIKVPFGKSDRYIWNGKYRFHNGIDTTGYSSVIPDIERIFAFEPFTVMKVLQPNPDPLKYSQWDRDEDGNWKRVRTARESPTSYVKVVGKWTGAWYNFKHTKALSGIKPGIEIARGEYFADCGNFGNSLGPHTHHEVYPRAKARIYSYRYKQWTWWPTETDPEPWYNEKLKPADRLRRTA